MRAASVSNSLSGKMYDTANNWTTVLYGWKNSSGSPARLTGTWDAPGKQQQWWVSKRPLQTDVLVWNETATPPSWGKFYENKTCIADDGVTISCPDTVVGQPEALRAQVRFRNNHIMDCNGVVWLPDGLNLNLTDKTWTWGEGPYDSTAQRPTRGDTWRFGNNAADNTAARNLLRSFLLPAGTDISWRLTDWCAPNSTNNVYLAYRDQNLGAWKAYFGPADDAFGPNAVYNDGRYPAPVGSTLEATEYYVDRRYVSAGSGSQCGTCTSNGTCCGRDCCALLTRDLGYSKMSLQHIRFGLFNTDLYNSTQYGGSYPSSAYSFVQQQRQPWTLTSTSPPLKPWYHTAWCPVQGNYEIGNVTTNATLLQATNQSFWSIGDTCVLSVTPVQPDVSSNLSTCASALPHGIPFITCRAADGTLRRLDPIEFNRPNAWRNIRATVDFFIGRSVPLSSSSDYSRSLPSGLLPDVACNKRAYSARFGGRCAAPVVQYLAYDEAYHLASNQVKYGLPEYGGCLSGGLMRYLGTNVTQNPAAYTAQWNSFWQWYTPPLWPYETWYRMLVTKNNTSFLNSQKSLDSMFVYQDAFKVPAAQGPAGESLNRLTNRPCHVTLRSVPELVTDSSINPLCMLAAHYAIAFSAACHASRAIF